MFALHIFYRPHVPPFLPHPHEYPPCARRCERGHDNIVDNDSDSANVNADGAEYDTSSEGARYYGGQTKRAPTIFCRMCQPGLARVCVASEVATYRGAIDARPNPCTRSSIWLRPYLNTFHNSNSAQSQWLRNPRPWGSPGNRKMLLRAVLYDTQALGTTRRSATLQR